MSRSPRTRPGWRPVRFAIREAQYRELDLLAAAHGVAPEVAAQWLFLEALRRRLAVPNPR